MGTILTTQRSPGTASATKIGCVVGYPKSALASPPMVLQSTVVESSQGTQHSTSLKREMRAVTHRMYGAIASLKLSEAYTQLRHRY